MKKLLLIALLLPLYVRSAAQTEERVSITAITPSVQTGQDYSPWLSDDLNNLVKSVWTPENSKYIDIKLTLGRRCRLTRLSLYDYTGTFEDNPAYLYAMNGTTKTLLGVFKGLTYQTFVDVIPTAPVAADAIVIRKYGNNIPQKVRVFASPRTQSVITFAPLPVRKVGDAAFVLTATSNNTQTPISFSSSNPAVVSVARINGSWWATPHAAGTANITAAQAGSIDFTAAANVVRSQVVQAATVAEVVKIPIDPDRWYVMNNTTTGLAGLFDGITDVSVHTGWGKMLPTYDSYYPLLAGEEMVIESVRFFDGAGMNTDAPVTLSIMTDTWQRIPFATFVGDQYLAWVGPYPGKQTFRLNAPVTGAKYLVLTTSGAYPNEVELYGSYRPTTAAPAPSADTLAVRKRVKLKQTIGVNGFEWDFLQYSEPTKIDEAKVAAVKNFAWFRHYMDWEKLELTEGSYTFSPVWSGGWDYDAMYQWCKANGVEVLACLQTLPGWMLNTYPEAERYRSNTPVRYGKDFAAPASYIEQAKVGFQYAARYGSNPNVDRSLVKVNPNRQNWWEGANVVKIGLGLVKYIECDHERDKWWGGRKAYQTGREYAANLSAFYDGHLKTLGPGVGVKNADPAMQVVMGGVAAPETDYVRGMIDWCKQYRGYRPDGSVNLCWDVINYHIYANDAASSQEGNSSRGAAPEVAGADRTARKFIQMAHQEAKNMPVWVTETGYDINQGSPLKAIAIGQKSVLDTQADWILRTALLYARTGIDKVFFYELSDHNINDPTKFSSMGLINPDKTRKPAADFLHQTNRLFGEYAYTATLHADPIVDRYESNGKVAYMLVVPDERNRTASYTLALGGVTTAYIYKPVAGKENMVETAAPVRDGKLTLTVTETPVFVTTSPVKPAAPAAKTAASRADSTGDAFAVQVYPNPARTRVTVVVENGEGSFARAKVVDAVSGKLLQTCVLAKTTRGFSGEMDLTALKPGQYILEVEQAHRKVHRKIIRIN